MLSFIKKIRKSKRKEKKDDKITNNSDYDDIKLEPEDAVPCLRGCNLKTIPSCEEGFKIFDSGCGKKCPEDIKTNLLSEICDEKKLKRLKRKNCRHCIKSKKCKKPKVCCKCKKCDYITDDPCDGSCFNIFRL